MTDERRSPAVHRAQEKLKESRAAIDIPLSTSSDIVPEPQERFDRFRSTEIHSEPLPPGTGSAPMPRQSISAPVTVSMDISAPNLNEEPAPLVCVPKNVFEASESARVSTGFFRSTDPSGTSPEPVHQEQPKFSRGMLSQTQRSILIHQAQSERRESRAAAEAQSTAASTEIVESLLSEARSTRHESKNEETSEGSTSSDLLRKSVLTPVGVTTGTAIFLTRAKAKAQRRKAKKAAKKARKQSQTEDPDAQQTAPDDTLPSEANDPTPEDGSHPGKTDANAPPGSHQRRPLSDAAADAAPPGAIGSPEGNAPKRLRHTKSPEAQQFAPGIHVPQTSKSAERLTGAGETPVQQGISTAISVINSVFGGSERPAGRAVQHSDSLSASVQEPAARPGVHIPPTPSEKRVGKENPESQRHSSSSSQRESQKRYQERGRSKAQSEAARKGQKTSGTTPQQKSAPSSQAGSAAKKSAKNSTKAAATKKLLPILAVFMSSFLIFGGGVLFVLGTAFGIFASGDSGIRDAVARINQEYEQRLLQIRSSVSYNDLNMSGAISDWKSVLAVYAVVSTTDEENPQEVVTMDEEKGELLRQIFWLMNTVSYHVDYYEIPDPGYTDPTEPESTEPGLPAPTRPGIPDIVRPLAADGDIHISLLTETEPPMLQQTRLSITVSHRTAEEMADYYSFTADQRQQLIELLAPENLSVWNDVLYGISTGGNGDIVSVAVSQLGNYNGTPYWQWYGLDSWANWCACFVSWCADQCGHIDAGIIPKFSSCTVGSNWFRREGRWASRSYTPAPGDVIFIDWESDGDVDHVGLVEYVLDGQVHTIEGNRDNAVIRDTYDIGSSVIYGYGVPDYPLESGETEETTSPALLGSSSQLLEHIQEIKTRRISYEHKNGSVQAAAKMDPVPFCEAIRPFSLLLLCPDGDTGWGQLQV